MARVQVQSTAWGYCVDRSTGRPRPGALFVIDTTVYEAVVGATEIDPANFVTDDEGLLPGFVEPGVYTLQGPDVGEERQVDAVSGVGNDTSLAVLLEAPRNPKDPQYGAVGDGSNDDTAEIQAALDDAGAAGGEVYLPPGEFLISSDLQVGSDVTLRGAGRNSQLVLDGPAHTSSSIDGITNSDPSGGNTGIVIEDLRIVGPEDGTLATADSVDYGKGIWLIKPTDCTIRNVWVSRVNIQGIRLDLATRCHVLDSTVREIYSGNGISLDDLSIDNVIRGNTLKDIADCGIGTHNGALRTVIEGNTVTNTNFGRGIDVFGAPETVVVGNTLSAIGGSGGAGFGILLQPSPTPASPNRCVISGNSIVGSAQAAICVSGTAEIDDTLIVGNQIQGSLAQGIYLSLLAKRTTVTGNQANGCTSAGVYVEHSGGNIPTQTLVAGNQLYGNGNCGILATSLVTDMVVAANQAAGNTTADISVPAAVVVMQQSTTNWLALNQMIVQRAAGNDGAVATRVGTNSPADHVVFATGKHEWGSGGATRDVTLERLQAGVMRLSKALTLVAIAAGSVPNETVFIDSSNNKLSFKDSSGTTTALY